MALNKIITSFAVTGVICGLGYFGYKTKKELDDANKEIENLKNVIIPEKESEIEKLKSMIPDEELEELKKSEIDRLLGDSAYMNIVNFFPTEEEQINVYEHFVEMVLYMWYEAKSQDEVYAIAETIDKYMEAVTDPYLKNIKSEDEIDEDEEDSEFGDMSMFDEDDEDVKEVISPEAEELLNKALASMEAVLSGGDTDVDQYNNRDDGSNTSEKDSLVVDVVRKQPEEEKSSTEKSSNEKPVDVSQIQEEEKEEFSDEDSVVPDEKYKGAELIRDEFLRNKYYYTFCNVVQGQFPEEKMNLIYILQRLPKLLSLDPDAFESYQALLDDLFENIKHPTKDFNLIDDLNNIFGMFKEEYTRLEKRND